MNGLKGLAKNGLIVIFVLAIIFSAYFVFAVPSADSVSVSTNTNISQTKYAWASWNYTSGDNNLQNGTVYTWFVNGTEAWKDNQLIGYWKLDDNVIDSSQYSNNGIIINTSNEAATQDNNYNNLSSGGIVKGTIFFANRVNVTVNANLNIRNNITISGWVYATTYEANAMVVKNGGANNLPYTLGVNNGGLLVLNLTNSTDVVSITYSSLSTGKMHFIAGTYNGNTASLYLDGLLVNSVSMTGQLNSTGGNVFLAAQNWPKLGAGGPNDVTYDEIKLYNRTLSSAEILQEYNMMKYGQTEKNYNYTGTGTPAQDIPNILYHLDENTGTQTNDYFGNTTGLIVGNNVAWTNGLYGSNALLFNTTTGSGYVNVSFNQNLNITNSITIEAWIMSTGQDSSRGYIVAKALDSGDYSWNLAMDDTGALFFGLTNETVESSAVAPSSITLNNYTWYHVAAVWNGTNSFLYVNGTLDGTYNNLEFIGPLNITGSNLTIGGNEFLTNEFNGSIEEVAIYSRALSGSEINQSYLRGYPHFGYNTTALTPHSNVSVLVEPNDGIAFGTAVMSVNVTMQNTIPQATSVGLKPSTSYISSVLNASVIAIDNDLDTMTVTFRWYNNSVNIVNNSITSVSNGTNVTNTISSSLYSHFGNISVEVQIEDPYTNSTWVNSSTVQILNTLPEAQSISLDPSTAYATSTLNASVIAIDNDTDSMIVTFRWYNNSVNIINNTISSVTNGTNVTNILTKGNFSRFDNVTVEVYVDDTFVNSTFVNSSTVQILNTLPEATSIGIIPTTSNKNTAFNASVIAIDNDTDTMSVTFRWYVNNLSVVNNTITSVSNGTNVTNTISNGNYTHFDNVTVEVYADDSYVNSTYVNSSVVQILNTVPQATSVGLIPTTAYKTSTLNASVIAIDNDTDSMRVTFRWMKNNISIINNTISSVTNGTNVTNTILNTAYSHFDNVTVEIQIEDAYTNGTWVNSSTVQILNTIPEAQSIALVPTTTYKSTVLNASFIAIDDDVDSMSVTFRWYVNNLSVVNNSITSVASGTNVTNTISNGNYTHFDNVSVEVQIEDPYTNGTWVNSSAVQILNTLPQATSVSLVPTTAYKTSTLNASVIAIDNDTDSMTVTFRWYGNNISIAIGQFSGVTNGTNVTNTIPNSAYSHFDNVSVEIQIEDAYSNSTWINSSAVQILNTVPQATFVSLVPTTAYKTTSFNASVIALDNDTDTMSVTFRWYVNNLSVVNNSVTSVSNGTNVTNTISNGNYTHFDNVTVEVYADDSYVNSTYVNSSSVQVSNSIPLATSLGLIPTTVYEHSSFNSSVIALDNDTDSMRVTFRWMKNNVSVYNSTVSSIANGTNITNILTTGNFSHFDNVSVEIQIEDAYTNSTWMNSSSITVSNSVPQATSVSLVPTTAYKTTSFNASVIAIDNDTDSMNVTFRWMKNNVSIVNNTISSVTNGTNVTNTISNGNYSHFDNVTVEIQIEDPYTNATWVNSSSVQVSNSAPNVTTPSITPSSPSTTSTLNVSTVVTDDDSDNTTVVFKWYKGGVNIFNTTVSSVANGTNVTGILTSGNFSDGNTILVEAYANDSFANSTFKNSSSVSITAPSSSSSSTTVGGGSSVKPPVQEIRTLAQSISGLARLDFSQSSKLAIKNVILDLVGTATSVSIAVKEANAPSAGSPVASNVGGVYKYIEITKTVNANVSGATVTFIIEKKWMNDNGFSRNTVALNRLVNNIWTKLNTKYISEDSTYITFEAETPGFSTFAISAEKETIVQNTTVVVTQPGSPSINIDLLEGQILSSQDLLVGFKVSNLKLVEPGVNKDGEGHIALYIDNNDFVTVTSESYMLYNLAEGKHRIRVELHKNDHSSYNVGDVVNFEVKLVKPSETQENQDYQYATAGIIILVVLCLAYFYFKPKHKKTFSDDAGKKRNK